MTYFKLTDRKCINNVAIHSRERKKRERMKERKKERKKERMKERNKERKKKRMNERSGTVKQEEGNRAYNGRKRCSK